MAFFDCPRGNRVTPETWCPKAREAGHCYWILPLETERLKNPTATARNGSPGMERTLSQRRSSCLLFQIIGVETYLLFPDDQRDRQSASPKSGGPSWASSPWRAKSRRNRAAVQQLCWLASPHP